MLGRRKAQRRLVSAAAQLPVEAIEKMGFYGKLARSGHSVFCDEDFSQDYCPDNGRPSCPPSLLALARLLQHHEDISDAEVVDRCRYDIRWKVALDLDLQSIEAPFARSTYQAFRARLTLGEREGVAFEASVRAAAEAGLVPDTLRLAIDSSPVHGKGAVRDTYNLISHAIAKVLRAVAKHRGVAAADLARKTSLHRHVTASSVKGSEVVDWADDQAKRTFLGGLLDDARRVVAMARRAGCATEEVALLTKVIDQDVERGRGRRPRIRQGVAPDRMPSVADPEARHGRKSSGKTYTGHKAHMAVEASTGVIAAIDVTAPATPDGEHLAMLVAQAMKLTARSVDLVLGDCAYGTRTASEQAAAAKVELLTKMPAAPSGRFGPADFQVSADGQIATCPKGNPSSSVRPRDDGFVHRWSRADCTACPLKDRCTTAASRTLHVASDFHQRRERERYAQSEEGRAVLRERMAIEHAIGRIKNLGAEAARYFGRAKTKAQLQWTAAVTNLSLAWTANARGLS